MVVYHPSERTSKGIAPGIHIRSFWGDNLTLAVVDLDAQAVLPLHSHPHEQGGYIIDGEIEFTIAGKTSNLKSGDVYIIPGGVEHSVRVGEKPVRLLDIFTPLREDFKY